MDLVYATYQSSFNRAKKEDSANFLASQSSSHESSSWLNVLPSKTIGTVLPDNVFRISRALRSRSDICIQHNCDCGKAVVNSDGILGLSCRRRHLKLALSSTQIPSRLKPMGLNHNKS